MEYGENMVNADAMRMTGVCIFAVAVVQIGVSTTAYDFTYANVGSWWAGMIVAVAGLFAMISKKRWAATIGIALSVAALVLCFVGTIIDGLNSAVFRDFDICINTGTGERYGDPEIRPNKTLPCIIEAVNITEHNIQLNITTTGHYHCVCASDGDPDVYDCIDIKLRGDSGDCEKLLTVMPELLLASCLILLACLFLVMFYSCMSCRSVCCSDNMVVPDAPVPASATYYVVSATDQPPAVLLSHSDVTSTHAVDIETNESGNNASGTTGAGGAGDGGGGGVHTAQGGTYTATITAYPVKG